MIEAEMLKALACQAKGDMETALSCLSDALSIAEPENFVSMFVIEGQPMARLLYLAAERGICCEYCRRLLAVLPPAVKTQPKQSQGEGMIEPLSDREREVLKLLREGLSNREIAASLVISLSTVKGHTASIFAKLNVHSRVRAVSRARELGLLNT